MDLDINEYFEVVEIDNSKLNELKRSNNTIETGATQILEGLDMFCEDMLDKYEDSVPYEKLFCALRQVISSALEKDSVRNAIMTGIINERKSVKTMKTEPVIKTATITKAIKNTVPRNLQAIKNYARNHTTTEIAKHFNFDSTVQARQYCYCHKISFVKQPHSCPRKYDEEQIRTLAKDMTTAQMARMFNISRVAMFKILHRYGISYKGQKTGVKNE